MGKGITGIALAIVVYIVANKLIEALVTGTFIGDVLMQQIIPIACSIGAVLLAFRTFLRGE
jgi:hypothetical protein